MLVSSSSYREEGLVVFWRYLSTRASCPAAEINVRYMRFGYKGGGGVIYIGNIGFNPACILWTVVWASRGGGGGVEGEVCISLRELTKLQLKPRLESMRTRITIGFWGWWGGGGVLGLQCSTYRGSSGIVVYFANVCAGLFRKPIIDLISIISGNRALSRARCTFVYIVVPKSEI